MLLFAEEKLEELADVLKLRRKRRVSEKERERLAELSRKHSQKGLTAAAEARAALSEREQLEPERTIAAQQGAGGSDRPTRDGDGWVSRRIDGWLVPWFSSSGSERTRSAGGN